jgi:quinolinate synthase
MNKIDKFLKLKKERNAVVLAHYYQEAEIQDLADYLGDSLYLAQAAQKTTADVILFCGVHFMAETAKILNPQRIVLVPDMEAGCSLADSAEPSAFKAWIDSHPGSVVISYINCSAEVKAMSDIICTSANAERIVASVAQERQILFAPDKYLGGHVMRKTGRELVLWDGTCQVHEAFSEQELIRTMGEHPQALVLAHPECPEHLLGYADYIGSTNGILDFAEKCDFTEFIILTEPGILHPLRKASPDKEFYTVASLDGCSCNNCPYMKLNTIDKMIAALETLSPSIEMDENLRLRALKPLERMLELSK